MADGSLAGYIYLHWGGVDGLLRIGVEVAVDAGQDWLGLLLEEVDQEDGE